MKINAGDGPATRGGVGKGDDAPCAPLSPTERTTAGGGATEPDPAPKCETCNDTGWTTTSYPKELDGSGEPFDVSCPDCNDGVAEWAREPHQTDSPEGK